MKRKTPVVRTKKKKPQSVVAWTLIGFIVGYVFTAWLNVTTIDSFVTAKGFAFRGKLYGISELKR